MKKAGEGDIFRREEYNPTLAVGALIIITAALITVLRLDWGLHLFGTSLFRRKKEGPPEAMT